MMGSLRQNLTETLNTIWYGKSGWTTVLRPLSWLYVAIVVLRRLCYRLGIFKVTLPAVPVIVVGNLTVGGTGKTPLVIWLANYLQAAGFKPGIISRGYGGHAQRWPQQVRPDADPMVVGDEALVIARRTRCPMAVGPDRIASVNALLKYADVNVIISDDGLQHYALGRQIEIAVVDGVRQFGNGFCLPAGPLRERRTRLVEVDFIITNGVAMAGEQAMRYVGKDAINIRDQSVRLLESFRGEQLCAVAGIGNPDRFFNYIRGFGIRLTSRAFSDHHDFKHAELLFAGDQPLLMTEKDAVKCERFAAHNWWYVPIEVQLPDEFGKNLLAKLEKVDGQKTA